MTVKEPEPRDPAALFTARARVTRPARGVNRLTVCHVISSLMYGGGQRVALDLVKWLGRESALETRLVLIGDRVADGLTLLDVPTTHVTAYDGRYNRPLSLARAAFALRRAIRSDRTDIVHSHGWDCNVIVGLACAGLPIRHVVHQHILADWVSLPTRCSRRSAGCDAPGARQSSDDLGGRLQGRERVNGGPRLAAAGGGTSGLERHRLRAVPTKGDHLRRWDARHRCRCASRTSEGIGLPDRGYGHPSSSRDRVRAADRWRRSRSRDDRGARPVGRLI